MEFLAYLLYGIFAIVGILISIAIICIIGAFLWFLTGTIILKIADFFSYNLKK